MYNCAVCSDQASQATSKRVGRGGSQKGDRERSHTPQRLPLESQRLPLERTGTPEVEGLPGTARTHRRAWHQILCLAPPNFQAGSLKRGARHRREHSGVAILVTEPQPRYSGAYWSHSAERAR